MASKSYHTVSVPRSLVELLIKKRGIPGYMGYRNVSEYVIHLIRVDLEKIDQEKKTIKLLPLAPALPFLIGAFSEIAPFIF